MVDLLELAQHPGQGQEASEGLWPTEEALQLPWGPLEVLSGLVWYIWDLKVHPFYRNTPELLTRYSHID